MATDTASWPILVDKAILMDNQPQETIIASHVQRYVRVAGMLGVAGMRSVCRGRPMSVAPEPEQVGGSPSGSAKKQTSARRGTSFEPSWVAAVKSTADRLDGELLRASPGTTWSADHEIARKEISRARSHADRSALKVRGRIRPLWRRTAAWWTGYDVDQAWTALHTASEALLIIEDPGVVKAQLGDTAAAVVTALSPGDIRAEGYLKTLELLAPSGVYLSEDDQKQLRAIREVCDNSFDAAHGDARVYRNTLIQLGRSRLYLCVSHIRTKGYSVNRTSRKILVRLAAMTTASSGLFSSGPLK